MENLTLQRNMDDGYGTVYCIQKQDFALNKIHEYFNIEEPFQDVDSVVSYLNDKWENEYDKVNEIMCDLDESDDNEHFLSIANPNGYGDDTDSLVLIYKGETLFEN